MTPPGPSRRDPPELTIVTGASGWFGRTLMRTLASASDDLHRVGTIRALAGSHLELELLEGLGDQVELFVGDITERGLIDRLFADAQGADVIHAAGVVHPERVSEFERVNVGGTAAVATAARAARVRRLVHVSSNSPFGVNPRPDDLFRAEEPYNPYMEYGRTKMEAEIIVRAAHCDDLETTVVRPPWFYGPHQPARQTAFLTLIRKGRFPLIGDGSNRRSMVHVDNLVQGVVLAELTEEAAGRAYWIADRQSYTMQEIIETTRRALAAEGMPVRDATPRLPSVVSRLAETADRMLQQRGIYQQQIHVLSEMNKTIACDISAAEHDLGYEPEIELYDGMRGAIAWCIAEGLEL